MNKDPTGNLASGVGIDALALGATVTRKLGYRLSPRAKARVA